MKDTDSHSSPRNKKKRETTQTHCSVSPTTSQQLVTALSHWITIAFEVVVSVYPLLLVITIPYFEQKVKLLHLEIF